MGGKGWQNWGHTLDVKFEALRSPRDEDELIRLIRSVGVAGGRLRPLGAGHSFTPLVATEGTSVRLDYFSGVRSVDLDQQLVVLGAGTRLRDLPRMLGPYQLAFPVLGDVDTQTLAGALSTGTHGTGAFFTGLASQVRAMRIALADGTVVSCSPDQRSELFQAARVGLGAFGVITEVTLQCVPEFLLAALERQEPLEAVLENFPERMSAADHVEFYWFPHTDVALVKANSRLPLEAGRLPLARWRGIVEDEVVNNGLFGLSSVVGSVVPAVVPMMNQIATRLVATRRYTDTSQSVFTSPRRVRFREMEYAVPRNDLPAVLRQIRTLIDRRGWRISFPLEIRVAAADDVWLSPAYQRDTAYLALHRYHREPFAEYFLAAEQVLAQAAGRPHWGKLHSLEAARLAERYPRFAEVVRVRRSVDPAGVFGSPYLDRLLGTVG